MPLLAGFDVGSTTSGFMLAEAALERNCVTGRRQFASPRLLYRSAPAFTPLDGEDIDLNALEALLVEWRARASQAHEDLAAVGAIVTGLAARRRNADGVCDLIRAHFGEAMVATADDPNLESWLAFMGACGTLSRRHAKTTIINLDIGGGAANAALGRDGEVLATGCVFIGARHFVFEPGGYRLLSLSPMGRELADELEIEARPGSEMSPSAISALTAWYVAGLEAIVQGRSDHFDSPAGRSHQQVPFAAPNADEAEITFSGGVGELIYHLARGERPPGTTAFGDLGVDLAQAILASPLLSRSVRRLAPEFSGRATIAGMTLHGTEMSGNSLFLSPGVVPPIRDLPVARALSPEAPEAEFRRAVTLAAGGGRGGCVQIDRCPSSVLGVKKLASRLWGTILATVANGKFAPERPLVVLIDSNCGKTLGSYLTDWGRRALSVIVVDEVAIRHAKFVNIGVLRDGMAPVAYYGLQQMDARDERDSDAA